MYILARGNDAIRVNPITGVDESLTVHGSDWLWAVTAIYCFALIGCLVMSFAAKESQRVFHYLFTFSLLVGAITYYAQASNLGWSRVDQVNNLGNDDIRQVFWVKYVNWMLAFPSVTLALGLISGVSWTTIICNIFVSLFWVGSYLAGAYVSSSYKWGFFAFGTFAWLILAMSTINESREAAHLVGIDKDYIMLSGWTNLLWIIYPVAWGLTDGGNRIGVTGSSIFFGVLDTLMVPVLSAAFLLFARNWDYQKLSIAFSDSRPSRETDAAAVLKENAPHASA
ncbi:ion channel activity [Aspergillus pseudoviridinutans]|uniref:Ion channel activity n=1 Tax=Aspergillus pseudoviridinutans TaxID=1517512 RepID=A0A9P3BFR9_9EURO|nr:ion channel activity [Aspergillus pseudoviridinutans]GIJ90357.1 ion channel activity [Aspergillus pseudoviridinutans]